MNFNPNKPMGTNEALLLISTLPPLLLLFLILTFDRHSLLLSSSLYVATIHPVCYSLFFISIFPLLRLILAHRQLRLLVIASLVFSGYSAVLFTRIARPSLPWEFGLYLSLLVWGAFVDQALDLVPCLSLFFYVHIVVFLLFPDVYLKAYPTACFTFSCGADLAV